MTGPNGEDLSSGDTQVADFETLVPWTRPGVIAIKEFDVGTIGAAQGISIFQNAPVNLKLRAHVEIFFSQNEAISDADFDTITGGTGIELWNPHEWAKLSASGSTLWEAGFDDIDRTYRGFRVIDPTDNDYSSGNIDLSGNVKMGILLLAWQNGRYFGRFSPFTNETANDSGAITDGTVLATGTVSGGPDKPEGKIWMIDVQNPKAFTDVDGVDYYKKTFVWSYVPDFENGEDIWDDAP
jgi:hypothetical protein